MRRYRSNTARLTTAAAALHEFLHGFDNQSNNCVPRKHGNQSLKSCGWNFGETNLNGPRNLELIREAHCSVMHQLRTKSRLHEFLQQKCFLADAQGRDLF